uniref:Uncharacterized protein n=1 Tax=Tanacetum cinerariifolium TaxID=118510 RepID=A0A6L2L940_TANCI|nr:hypothetical protein [Tanacetum cinerariifolium]
MVAIDGVGFDWSYLGDDEVPTNMKLMSFSDSEETSPFSLTIKNMMEDLLLLQAVLKEILHMDLVDTISSTQQMVINSPRLTDKKELAIPGQTTTDKEFSNPLMAGSLPKTIISQLLLLKPHNFILDLKPRTQKDIELPQTRVPIKLGANKAVNQDEGDRVERVITTDASLEAALDYDNITKTQTTTMPNVDVPQGIDTGGRPRRQ